MHRDIKPANIIPNMITQKLKIVDFGSAEFYLPGSLYSREPGKLAYRAPEMIIGDSYYDPKVDLWSFGCILAQMIFRVDFMFYGRNESD